MKAKIKKLKVDLSNIDFKDPSTITDGTNGRILETAMEKQGFPIDKTGTLDLPGAGLEVKSRGAETSAMHTVGTMTYDDIINTPWDETPFKQKLKTQYRVTISKDKITGEVSASGQVVDFDNSDTQKRIGEAYETCRAKLKAQGKIIKGQTISGGQFGALEHKPGKSGNSKSFALRIPNSGMKKILGSANMLNNKLFEFEN